MGVCDRSCWQVLSTHAACLETRRRARLPVVKNERGAVAVADGLVVHEHAAQVAVSGDVEEVRQEGKRRRLPHRVLNLAWKFLEAREESVALAVARVRCVWCNNKVGPGCAARCLVWEDDPLGSGTGCCRPVEPSHVWRIGQAPQADAWTACCVWRIDGLGDESRRGSLSTRFIYVLAPDNALSIHDDFRCTQS